MNTCRVHTKFHLPFRRVARLALAFSVFFTTTFTRAGETETKVAETTTQVTVQMTTVDALDKYANSSLSIGENAAAHNPLSKSLAAYNIGVSLKNLIEADTDKGRLYAALDGALGVVTLLAVVNPALALALQVGLMLAKMTDQFLSTQHQKEMMEIMKKIKEYQEQYLTDLNKMTSAEQRFLLDNFTRLEYANQTILEQRPAIMNQCSSIKPENGYEDVEVCMTHLRVLALHHKQFIDSAQLIVQYEHPQMNINPLLEHFKTSKEKLRENIAEYRKDIETFEDLLGQVEAYMASSLAKTLQDTIHDEALLSSREAFYSSCLNDMTQLQAATVQWKLLKGRSSSSLPAVDAQRAQENVLQLIALIEEKECFEIVDSDPGAELFGQMLKGRAKTWQRLKEVRP